MNEISERDILDELKKLFEDCKGQPALESQVLYVIKLQNELTKIKGYSLHSYEKTVFGQAMKIFNTHFIKQVRAVLDMDGESNIHVSSLVYEKHEYITDIQNAVGKMIEIFQNMVGSIKNVDQPLFPTISENMYVFDASPKILTFYSHMLNKLAELLDSSQEYVFLLYPAMTDIIYTDVLFRKRHESGKVIVVTFPESLIEHPGVIPILFHEAFHVVERNFRYRKLRAQCYLENIFRMIEVLLYDGLRDDDSLNSNLSKQVLTRDLFEDTVKDFFEWMQTADKSNRLLYANALIENVKDRIQTVLIGYNEKISDAYVEECLRYINIDEKSDFGEFNKYISGLISDKWKIKENIMSILSNNLLYEFGERYMDIYREGYADIAACLLLNLQADDYNAAFELSCQFSVPNEEYVDRVRVVRQYLVSDAIGKYGNEETREGWKKQRERFYDKIERWGKAVGNDDFSKEGGGVVNLVMDKEILRSYERYFEKVAMTLSEHFDRVENIQQFRDTVRGAMMLDESVLTDIFLGILKI